MVWGSRVCAFLANESRRCRSSEGRNPCFPDSTCPHIRFGIRKEFLRRAEFYFSPNRGCGDFRGLGMVSISGRSRCFRDVISDLLLFGARMRVFFSFPPRGFGDGRLPPKTPRLRVGGWAGGGGIGFLITEYTIWRLSRFLPDYALVSVGFSWCLAGTSGCGD